MAAELVESAPAETVRTMIELFDWYAGKKQERGAGFLVDSIRNPAKYRFPPGFESSARRAERKATQQCLARVQEQTRVAREQRRAAAETTRLEPFLDFWSTLDEMSRADFEIRALTAAKPLWREGYDRRRESGDAVFEQYRQLILRDYFERTQTEYKA
jgi:hypothetical protein